MLSIFLPEGLCLPGRKSTVLTISLRAGPTRGCSMSALGMAYSPASASSSASAGASRPPIRIVLGLDFGGTKIAAAVCDSNGVRLSSRTIESRAEEGAQAVLERGIAAARALLQSAAPGSTLTGVGACTLGIPGDDGVELAPNIPGWDTLAFGHELCAAFPGVPVRMGTDVKAAAQAELSWGALSGCDPALYLCLLYTSPRPRDVLLSRMP